MCISLQMGKMPVKMCQIWGSRNECFWPVFKWIQTYFHWKAPLYILSAKISQDPCTNNRDKQMSFFSCTMSAVCWVHGWWVNPCLCFLTGVINIQKNWSSWLCYIIVAVSLDYFFSLFVLVLWRIKWGCCRFLVIAFSRHCAKLQHLSIYQLSVCWLTVQWLNSWHSWMKLSITECWGRMSWNCQCDKCNPVW